MKAEEIVIRTIEILGDRSGFDEWWEQIDFVIQREIIEELERMLSEFIEN